MELTPRTGPAGSDDQSAPRRRKRNPWAYGVLVAVLLGLGVVVWQGLTSASLYFYNADEAVEQREELGDRRFRLQGTVLGDTISSSEDGVEFTVAFNGARVDVRHDGDPPELFQPGIPVVLEGRWSEAGDWFDSDTIKVKHSEQYEAENEDRLEDAEDGESAGADPR
ncbi:MAG TPA: cytochrome c maturation protein CcmE [Acidimicrobiales bacterium]